MNVSNLESRPTMALVAKYRNLFAAISMALFAFSALMTSAQAQAIDPIKTWNELALATARVKSLSDAQSARLYAMLNVAMYDAVNGALWRVSGHVNRDNMLLAINAAQNTGVNADAAAVAAAQHTLALEYSTWGNIYSAQYQADFAALGLDSTTLNKSIVWGNDFAQKIFELRVNDGSGILNGAITNETQNPGTGVGEFRTAWSGTQFRALAPFGIALPSLYTGTGPPAMTSVDYAAALNELKALGSAANIDSNKLATYQFWNLGSGTSQPPGAWIQIALTVAANRGLGLEDKARLLALVSVAMVDTVAPTVMTKYTYRHWRPTTAIREAANDGNALTEGDPAWTPRAGGIGSTPEYWSGHSTFSAAAATALAGFFCADNIQFSIATDSSPGGQVRTYPSFSTAANEAGMSRVYGGVHFDFSNQAGLAAGRAVAREVLSRKALINHSPTHFGECPF